ncbi:MAG TPA: ATP-grasp domain-containing protein, partial [Bacteroidetes bacterium]|nr:ATP-grasp domain-containing protein [Bacteroidota bacterium]
MIHNVLIANRGEIAVRIIRGCREMGIRTVAVYSEVDRLSLHTRLADEAYPIGKAPSSESYLVQDRIIATALKAGADAVHPGYGFLAENGDFAESVEKAGLIWIGPPAEAIRLMGDKTVARQRMKEAGVPTVPGTLEPISDETAALKTAEEIGFPVLLKAAAGGGGKGMRVVSRREEFQPALQTARSEAKSAFGDDRVYIEKYLE